MISQVQVREQSLPVAQAREQDLPVAQASLIISQAQAHEQDLPVAQADPIVVHQEVMGEVGLLMEGQGLEGKFI